MNFNEIKEKATFSFSHLIAEEITRLVEKQKVPVNEKNFPQYFEWAMSNLVKYFNE